MLSLLFSSTPTAASTPTPSTDWRSKIPIGSNSITYNDIARFRVGKYENADKDVQAKWCLIMLHFLPHICTAYVGWNFKKTQSVSQVATPSDEALLYWYLECYVAGWEKDQQEEDDRRDTEQHSDAQTGARKKRKKEGQHFSRTKLKDFMVWLALVDNTRKDPDTGSGWDDALKAEATRQALEEAGRTHGDTHGYGDEIPVGQAEPQIVQDLVMPYKESGIPGGLEVAV